MAGTRSRSSVAAPESPVPRREAARLFDLYRALILVYGGFLLGMLTQAWRLDDDLVFWPWSLVLLLLLVGLVIWQPRRAAGGRPRGDI